MKNCWGGGGERETLMQEIDGGKPYLMVLIWDLMLLLFYQPVVIFYKSK